MKICLVTCLAQPALIPEDQLLQTAFEEQGAEVEVAPWNGNIDPFLDSEIVLVRTPWDYVDHGAAFREWLGYLHGAGINVKNSPDLMRWNMNKRYLLELGKKGAPLPPMSIVEPETDKVLEAIKTLGLTQAVIKPVISASSKGLSVLSSISEETVAGALQDIKEDVLVQPVLSEIALLGETSLIFFDHEYSHAARKVPKEGDIRSQEEFGGSVEPVTPPDWVVGKAQEILGLIPGRATYARVDVIIRDQDLTLMEVELIEPELFFRLAPESAKRFATAVLV